MTRTVVAVVAGSAIFIQPGFAADKAISSYHHRNGLVPQNHVVEVVTPPYSGVFVTNGFLFAGTSAACRRWVPGERIRLISGSWYGDCTAATFYNLSRRTTCETLCRGAAFWR